jgi:hypothetical protein
MVMVPPVKKTTTVRRPSVLDIFPALPVHAADEIDEVVHRDLLHPAALLHKSFAVSAVKI